MKRRKAGELPKWQLVCPCPCPPNLSLNSCRFNPQSKQIQAVMQGHKASSSYPDSACVGITYWPSVFLSGMDGGIWHPERTWKCLNVFFPKVPNPLAKWISTMWTEGLQASGKQPWFLGPFHMTRSPCTIPQLFSESHSEKPLPFTLCTSKVLWKPQPYHPTCESGSGQGRGMEGDCPLQTAGRGREQEKEWWGKGPAAHTSLIVSSPCGLTLHPLLQWSLRVST